VLGIGIIVGFVMLVGLLIFSYTLVMEGGQTNPVSAFIMAHHVEFMVISSFLGLAVGAAVYYLLREEMVEKTKAANGNANLLLRFLSEDERELILFMSEREGLTTQAELSKLPGMTRLKAHRLVERMEKKGLVFVEKYGKVNMLRLANELKESLGAGADNTQKSS
jgi:uncharacterized membrane protein